MKEIIIESDVHGVHHVHIDDEDYEKLSKYKWYISKGRNTFYVHRDIHIRSIKGKTSKKVMSIHRQIMRLDFGDKLVVDHINGDGLDNRKENLRVCTNIQNCQNRVNNRENCTSEYKGVYWDKSRSLWASEIKVNTKKTYLGRFKNENDAALAYNIAAIKYFGEYAKLNVIKE